MGLSGNMLGSNTLTLELRGDNGAVGFSSDGAVVDLGIWPGSGFSVIVFQMIPPADPNMSNENPEIISSAKLTTFGRNPSRKARYGTEMPTRMSNEAMIIRDRFRNLANKKRATKFLQLCTE